MEFRQIRYALTVAKERSFTRAAARLNVSQSAISEQVRQLEARIGFALFRRTGRGVEVTDGGRSYLAEAQRIASELMSLDDLARRLRGQDQETLTLGLASGMGPLILPALFPGRERGRSAPRLDIRTAPTRVMLAELFEERLDGAFTVNADPDRVPAGLVAERICEIEMRLAVPQGHPLTRLAVPIDLARLFEEPLIMSELGLGYGQIVASAFEGLGLRPSVLSVIDNIEAQLVVVRNGGGIAFVPDGAIDADVARGTLAALPVTPAPRFDLGLYRRRQPLSRRKEELLRTLPERVRGHIESSAARSA